MKENNDNSSKLIQKLMKDVEKSNSKKSLKKDLDCQKENNDLGKPNSLFLKEIQEAGFNPIGITIMMCEETLIFKTKDECDQAYGKFLPEGWWYCYSEWDDTRKWYVDTYYNGDYKKAPKVYWLVDIDSEN